jgi:hypothetical protein
MKNDTITTALNTLLAALVFLCVLFEILSMFNLRKERALMLQGAYAKNALSVFQSLANDTAAYNASHPSADLTRLLQSIQAKPAAK